MATSNSANPVTEIAAAPVSLRRRAMNALVTGAAAAAVLLVLLPLGAIFVYLVYKGFGSLNWAFLTQIPKPVGEAGGGMANAIAGSDRKSTRLNSSHQIISYAVFCLK